MKKVLILVELKYIHTYFSKHLIIQMLLIIPQSKQKSLVLMEKNIQIQQK